MMNKLLTKSTKKLTLISVIMAAIVLLAIVFTAIFGVNTATTVSDHQTITVKMSTYYYNNDNQREKVETVCETEFAANGVKALYVYNGAMSGDECEIMYVFDKNADLTLVKDSLELKFAAEEYDGAFIFVEKGTEIVTSAIPSVAIVRAAVAVLVFAILAFIYVWIRHNLYNAIVAGGSVLLSCIMSAAVVLLVRIPVTASVVYACAIAPLFAAVFVLLSINKLRADESEKPLEEKIVNAVAVKETLLFTAALGLALVLVGAIATWSVRWFALIALIALLVSAAIALFFAPALQLPLLRQKEAADAERTKYGYVGAKKAEKNETAKETEESEK